MYVAFLLIPDNRNVHYSLLFVILSSLLPPKFAGLRRPDEPLRQPPSHHPHSFDLILNRRRRPSYYVDWVGRGRGSGGGRQVLHYQIGVMKYPVLSLFN